MAKTYVTFGTAHLHAIGNKIFNGDCVAVIECENKTEGRNKALEIFGRQFSFAMFEDEFSQDYLIHYPRGLIEV